MSEIGSVIGSIYNENENDYTYGQMATHEEQIKKLQAEVQLLKDMLSEQNDEDLEQYLSDRERGLLKKMNTMSNKITEQSAFVKYIMSVMNCLPFSLKMTNLKLF